MTTNKSKKNNNKQDGNKGQNKNSDLKQKNTKEENKNLPEPKVEPKKEQQGEQKVINMHPDLKREDFGKEQWIKVDDLVLDTDTQRSPMESHVRKIMKNFDAKSFGRISVSKRKDGKYYVTDGWHRTLACKQLGMEEVPCIVIENNEEEVKNAKKMDALQFLKINENSSAVSAIDKYKIGVSGEVEEWLRVKQVVEYNGLKVGTSASRINAVASIYKYINSSSKPETIAKKMEHMRTTLGILYDVAGVEGITNISINAMCLFVREYIAEGIITEDDALTVFSKINLRQMITNAQTLKNTNTGGNIITSLAYLLYKEYNQITKGKKLPPRFEI